MTFYINLEKIDESVEFVQYNFKTSDDNVGLMQIRKTDGNVTEIVAAPNDDGLFFERAAWILMRHWRKNAYPDEICWRS